MMEEADKRETGTNQAALEDHTSPARAKGVRWKRRVTIATGLVALIAAAVVLPPLINIGRYQRQVTALVSRSMGRPVHLSSVELRALPRPGFVLHDLSVSEDPAFGAEPILSAGTVDASVRLFSLWEGKLEVDRLSVDEASLNLVRSPQGRWNLESLLHGAQPNLMASSAGNGGSTSRKPVRFPYLEATNSRVNLKNGAEKSPFSIVGTDLSLWQDDPGSWRVRLKGQPVRTDMEMSPADTGEVRMEASLQTAAELRQMPLKLQIEWREAQLGQLSRLLFGSDAGWRGEVTADVDVQGTLDSALTKARLRAVGVRREEFAPETPLDFDANCSFHYLHPQNAAHDVSCDTAIGDGRIHLKADLPGDSGRPEATLEVNQLPIQAGLDLLRTVRSGFAPGIVARGTANGTLTYKHVTVDERQRSTKNSQKHPATRKSADTTKPAPVLANVQGTITVDGAQLRGGGLKQSLVFPKMTWEPVIASNVSDDNGKSESIAAIVKLATRFTVSLSTPAKASSTPRAREGSTKSGSSEAAPPKPVPSTEALSPTPVSAQAITVRLGLNATGYDATVSGSAAVTRLRDLSYAFGLPHLDAVDNILGGTSDFELSAAGPWIPSAYEITPQQSAPISSASKSGTASAAPPIPDSREPNSVAGSMQLHHVQWKPPYLTRPVELSSGTVTLSAASVSLNSEISYGGEKDAVKGSAVVTATPTCKAGDCNPEIHLSFGALDAAAVQAAVLDEPTQKTLLSPIMDRMRSPSHPKWPIVTLDVQADSVAFGPATFHKPTLRLHIKEDEIDIESWAASVLSGEASGAGHFTWTGDKPEYSFEGKFGQVSAPPTGALLNSHWTGGPLSGSGDIKLSGLNWKDLEASATGHVKFAWPHGSMTSATQQPIHFESWSGTIEIQGGKIQLGENTMMTAKHSVSVAGAAPFGGPTRLTVGAPAKAISTGNRLAQPKANSPSGSDKVKP